MLVNDRNKPRYRQTWSETAPTPAAAVGLVPLIKQRTLLILTRLKRTLPVSFDSFSPKITGLTKNGHHFFFIKCNRHRSNHLEIDIWSVGFDLVRNSTVARVITAEVSSSPEISSNLRIIQCKKNTVGRTDFLTRSCFFKRLDDQCFN